MRARSSNGRARSNVLQCNTRVRSIARPRLVRKRFVRARRAFTLIELVIVLVIMGIISAVVVPALRNSGTQDATNALTAPVVSVLRMAQRTATERNAVVTVIIDPTTSTYRAQAAREGDTAVTGTMDLPAGAGWVTDSARLRVIFTPVGTVMTDSLVIRGPERVVAIRVDPWTGVITVSRTS